MKVGDRIRVFEIKKSWYDLEENIIGLQRPEVKDIEIETGVDLYLKDKSGLDYLHFCINGVSKRTSAKHVATMVITKIK